MVNVVVTNIDLMDSEAYNFCEIILMLHLIKATLFNFHNW